LVEQFKLERWEAREDVRGGAEALIRPAAKRSELGAGGVHEYAVGVEARGGWRPEDLDAREPRSGDTLEEPVQSLGVWVMGEEPTGVAHLCAEQERLASGPRAQVEDGLSGAGIQEESQELTALVLDLESALSEGGQRIEVGTGPVDMEGQWTPGSRAGGKALGAQADGQVFPGVAERIHTQGDGAWDVEVGAEVVCLRAQLPREVVGEPIRKGVPEGERRGLGRIQRRNLVGLDSSQGGCLGRWEPGETLEECEEQARRGRVGVAQEEVEAAAPEGDVVDDLLERLALGTGEGAMGPERAVHDSLGRRASEHEGDGLRGNRGKPRQRGPGLDLEPGERIKRDC
jgi:hypothetical protein